MSEFYDPDLDDDQEGELHIAHDIDGEIEDEAPVEATLTIDGIKNEIVQTLGEIPTMLDEALDDEAFEAKINRAIFLGGQILEYYQNTELEYAPDIEPTVGLSFVLQATLRAASLAVKLSRNEEGVFIPDTLKNLRQGMQEGFEILTGANQVEGAFDVVHFLEQMREGFCQLRPIVKTHHDLKCVDGVLMAGLTFGNELYEFDSNIVIGDETRWFLRAIKEEGLIDLYAFAGDAWSRGSAYNKPRLLKGIVAIYTTTNEEQRARVDARFTQLRDYAVTERVEAN